MITMTIVAEQVYDEVSKSVAEDTKNVTISLDGDTYAHKDFIKSKGFMWDADRKEWSFVAERTWFKANAYSTLREIAKTLGIKSSGIIISGTEAKEAMRTMDK